MSFQQKVAIVTGGAWGIGAETARKLASEGANVLIADKDYEAAKENAQQIENNGGSAQAIQIDLSVSEQIKLMIDTAINEWGHIDFLVQNGYRDDVLNRGSAVTLEEERWDSAMDVLTKALFIGAKHAIPHMQSNGGGVIINIASVHGILVETNRLVYEAGKAAVIAMTKQMAVDFGPSNIRVNCILPGHIVTERLQERWNKEPKMLDFFAKQYPLGRVGIPADIANAITFLCSDNAAFITGHPLVVDGGLTIQLQEELTVRLGKYAQENPFD